MGFPEVVFRIIEDNNCPLYEASDEFFLADRFSFSLPFGKPACVILVLDVTEVLLEYENGATPPDKSEISGTFPCSGCTGSIRISYDGADAGGDRFAKDDADIDAVSSLLTDYSFFQALEERHINELVPLLRVGKYARDDVVIESGDPGANLYIILSGRVEVLGDDGVRITHLGRGEVFGEMSLLSGDPVGATIRVAEPATILYISSRDFRKVVYKFPSLQMYFARMLARRLAKTNLEWSQDFASGMAGQLAEMPPVELFQALNVNQKTGVLALELSRGSGKVYFNEGELVGAEYAGVSDKEAFFEMLKDREGRFKFSHELPGEMDGREPLGNFMWLLMEGARKQDEEAGEEEAGT